MKKTYLLRKEKKDGSFGLDVATPEEWRAATERNKQLPAEQRRYFILDYIHDDEGELDCMVMEVDRDAYQEWHREHMAAQRNRKRGEVYQTQSMSDPLEIDGKHCHIGDTITADVNVEETVCSMDGRKTAQAHLSALRAELSAWMPWANDLLDFYLRGESRTCTDAIVKKYHVSPQTVRKYKRQFENFIKNFLSGVSFYNVPQDVDSLWEK